MRVAALLVGALAVTGVPAHPGEDISKEIADPEAMLKQLSHRSLNHCVDKIKGSALEARSIARRHELAASIMKKGGLVARDDEPIDKSHKSDAGYTMDTPITEIFGSNASCVLAPEVTEGPYYVTGEFVRQHIAESQKGVNLHLDIQVLNTETCEPVAGVYVEVWQTNSTGVYGGIVAKGDGNPDDKSNAKKTWLRGFQNSTEDGVVQFHTLFPGHYHGRAPHIHVAVHVNATAFRNHTIKNTNAFHSGQIFFDQDLINEVEKQKPYNTNQQTLVNNTDDGILRAAMAHGSDPFANYVYLNGKDVTDGLLGWISFGINTSYTRTIHPAGEFHGWE
ncbi:Intradiol ring-cleavage dioxygenase [Podospora aff. communis PSN243]|uniref:Intradiol ring-cleavage dioxygenase n=1 Tax=Podospora aff. communis PSN243 TaxID=3040156 RepID=A0AAV9G686_9PEZI|nr:Intradiol ring-cleavage dioxygenase [Podospora aff. communis PSN243]